MIQMSKKHLKRVGILAIILVILMILLIPRVRALNDGGTKIYKSLIYEVTKAHKIRTQGYIVEGTIIKLFGKEIYCSIPKDVEIIVDGKEKEEPSTKYNKSIDDVTLTLNIPNDWKYEELFPHTENDFYKYALKLYKTNEDTYAVLYFHNQIFGVCGTGRTSKQISLYNGYKATIGYYDGKDIWQDISFYEMNRYIAIINYGLEKDEAEEVLDFIKTIEIIENNDKEETIELLLKEGTITSKGATFILKNNTDKEYWYGPDYYIETKKDEKWSEIELDSPLVWNSIAYLLKANEGKEINIDWSIGYGELSNGQYRLVKNICKEGQADNICLYVEFEIE